MNQLKNQLAGLGILGKHSNLRFNVNTGDQESILVAIAKALAALNRTITHRHLQENVKGKTRLVPHELKLNGKTGWDSTLPVNNYEQTLEKWFDVHAIGGTQLEAEVAAAQKWNPALRKASNVSISRSW